MNFASNVDKMDKMEEIEDIDLSDPIVNRGEVEVKSTMRDYL